MDHVTFSAVPRFTSWFIYFGLLLCRFVNVFHLQSGYLHPDEFFQSLEVAAGDVHNLDVYRPWEFWFNDSGGPLRSIAGIGPMVHLPLRLYKHLFDGPVERISASENYNLTLGYSGSDLLNLIVLPTRLFTTMCSFTVDLFILYTSGILRNPHRRGRRCFLSISPPVSLILHASAVYGGLLYSTRTLANTWEFTNVSMFGLLFMIIIRSTQSPVLSKTVFIRVAVCMFLQAILSSWSIFVRTTYPLFILPMAIVEIFVVVRHFGIYFTVWTSSVCVLFASFVTYVCLFVDTLYYKTMEWPVNRVNLSDLVCVPCRFISYNSKPTNVNTHGSHPFYFHFLVNLPQMVGPVIILLALWPPGQRNLIVYVLWFSCLLPLLVLSCVPHQEARFLLPMVPQLLLLAGHRLESAARSGKRNLICSIWNCKLGFFLTFLWGLHQFILFILYATLHQGGLVKFFHSLNPANERTCSTNIFYRTYMPPRFPFGNLLNEFKEPCHRVIDLQDLNQLEHLVYEHGLTDRPLINLIYPGSISPPPINNSHFGLTYQQRLIFGHLSTEDLPYLFFNSSTSFNNFFYDVYSQLSLHVLTFCTDVKHCFL